MKATINNIEVTFNAGETILEVAKREGIFIPTLCAFLPLNHKPGTCRVCLVEVQKNGQSQIVTSCTTPLEEGMSVFTKTPTVREKQRRQVEWIFADHEQNCASCPRHGNCELQDAALYVGARDNTLDNKLLKKKKVDCSANALTLDPNKCIRCGRCVEVCRQIQGIGALTLQGTGSDCAVGLKGGKLWIDSEKCVQCGQCSLVCPVGAISEKDETEKAIEWLNDPSIKTFFAFAPAVRVTLGEEFNMTLGANAEKKIVTALKHMGADYVCDVNWAADVTIMEEGTELLERIKTNGTMPMMTSCCPGWINFVEKVNPEIIDHISTTRSPQAITGALAKTYFAKKKGIDPSHLRVISIMPCTAKKDEIKRDELARNGIPDTDLVLTVREFARLIKSYGLDINTLPESEFDSPTFSENTGAAVIFGATGGVMEAAVRTVYFVLTGKNLEGIDFVPVRGLDWIKEATVPVKEGLTLRLAVVHGLANTQKIVDLVKEGKAPYDFIEVMACPGGCIDGGGTPRVKNSFMSRAQARSEGLYQLDKARKIRLSHENEDVKTLYKEFLKNPCGELSHELLHTHYTDRKVKETPLTFVNLKKQ